MIDVAFTRAGARPAELAVVIDVLRATSTIVCALAGGYERVLVAGDIERARGLRAPGRVLAGEVDCVPPPDFDMGNSPADADPARGAELVLATTNGAPAIVAAADLADDVVLAALLNLEAVVAAVGQRDVLLLCAGTDGGTSIEDAYVAGRISAALPGARTDAARIAEAVAAAHPDAAAAIGAGRGASNLRAVGLEADVAFCARESVDATVPRVLAARDGVATISGRADDLEKIRSKALDNVLDASTSSGVA